ncbi:MAG TPA: hypothetical protein VMC08_10810 [Bacteroidales bacterium]|nr:hypothetical protein [Bacteroidales bacterium]
MKATINIIAFFILLLAFVLSGCSQSRYTTAAAPKNCKSDSSYLSPTGETIGWEDIKRMPR